LYYHVRIELNEKNKKDYHETLSELDKTDISEIIKFTPQRLNLHFFSHPEFLVGNVYINRGTDPKWIIIHK